MLSKILPLPPSLLPACLSSENADGQVCTLRAGEEASLESLISPKKTKESDSKGTSTKKLS